MKLIAQLASFALAMSLAACSENGRTEGESEQLAEASGNGCTKIPDRPVRRMKLVIFEGECPKGYEKLAPGEAERLARETRDARQREEVRAAHAREAALIRAQDEEALRASLEMMSVNAERVAAEAIVRYRNAPNPNFAIHYAAEASACRNARDAREIAYACRTRRQLTVKDIQIVNYRVYSNSGSRVICGTYRYVDVPGYDGSEEHEFVVAGNDELRVRYRSGELIKTDCRNEEASVRSSS